MQLILVVRRTLIPSARELILLVFQHVAQALGVIRCVYDVDFVRVGSHNGLLWCAFCACLIYDSKGQYYANELSLLRTEIFFPFQLCESA